MSPTVECLHLGSCPAKNRSLVITRKYRAFALYAGKPNYYPASRPRGLGNTTVGGGFLRSDELLDNVLSELCATSCTCETAIQPITMLDFKATLPPQTPTPPNRREGGIAALHMPPHSSICDAALRSPRISPLFYSSRAFVLSITGSTTLNLPAIAYYSTWPPREAGMPSKKNSRTSYSVMRTLSQPHAPPYSKNWSAIQTKSPAFCPTRRYL